jgi:hypothetical protein
MSISNNSTPSVTGNPKHGSPRDRGGADFYYHRPCVPHYWPKGTGHGHKVEEKDMTVEEIKDYHDGYAEAKKWGDQKQWD